MTANLATISGRIAVVAEYLANLPLCLSGDEEQEVIRTAIRQSRRAFDEIEQLRAAEDRRIPDRRAQVREVCHA